MTDKEKIEKLQSELSRLTIENTLLKSEKMIMTAELELARAALGNLATIYDDGQETLRRAEKALERN